MLYGHILGLLLMILQALGGAWSQTPAQSPCPDVFQYQTDSNGMWYGLITVPNPEPDFNIKLNVELSLDAFLPSRNAGQIRLVENKHESWRRIVTRDNRSLQYEIYFPLSSPLPVVKRITSNKNVVCEGNPPPMLTKLSLEHNLYPIKLPLGSNQDTAGTNDSIPNLEYTTEIVSFKPSPAPQIPPVVVNKPNNINPILPPPPPVITTPVTTSTTETPRPSPPRSPPPTLEIECGISVAVTIPLVINGAPTERGEWPWLVAVYIKSALPGLQFQCGGSLLSQTVVLTAAHCIKYKGRPEVKAESVVLYMGKFNLQRWTENNNQARDVERIHIHPDYKNDDTYDADLAVMILRDKVEYTLYVRPICLWKFADDIKYIVGHNGTVVGWGRDETGTTSSEPRKVTMPVVSQDVCVLSRKEFAFYTSNKTFCAGSLDGSGPCSGDSGGGFMIGYEDGDLYRWYLRGVVHLSLYDRQNQQCDLRSYFIYTDVAKYLNWVREFVI